MSIFSFIKSHVVLASAIGILVVSGSVIAGRVASRSHAPDDTGNQARSVALVDVAQFRSDGRIVSADGIVESVSQADIKSQVSAPIASVNVAIGDSVYAGQIIAQLENADIRAQVQAAQAALTLAQGQYQTTRSSAIDAVTNAYLAADTAVHTQIDPFLLSNQSQIYSSITDSTLSNKIRLERVDLNEVFKSWKSAIDTLDASSDDAEIRAAVQVSQEKLEKIRIFLDDIAKGINDAATISSGANLTTISSLQTVISAARSSVTGAKNSLTSVNSLLASSNSSTAAQASVDAARANVTTLQAQLAKTVITSPITGKIAALPLRVGELASPGQLIVTVVGGGGLQVRAYASDVDFSYLKVGNAASIQNGIAGTVISVAPSVNQGNKKVEIKISITDASRTGLVVGQNVRASIMTKNDTQTTSSATYSIPLQNVKIVPNGAFVYTVDEQSKVVAIPVTLGQVQGDRVSITAGISDGTKIIVPVYGLNEGEGVNVQ